GGDGGREPGELALERELAERPSVDPVARSVEQVVPRRVVAVDRPQRDARTPRDLGDGDLARPTGDEVDHGIEDARARPFGVLLAKRRRRRSGRHDTIMSL